MDAIALERSANTWGLVTKDTGRRSLQKLALAGALPLAEVVDLALSTAAAVEQIHAARVIHRDLHPGNLIVHEAQRSVELIDFAGATRWARSIRPVVGPWSQPGLLAYVSPELTGRVNRAVDHRSDLYSLGVILFELLIGVVPFNHTDPLELVHAHVARRPPDLSELSPGLPPAICHLVLRLLEKNAEDRYQSASGLRKDLERCKVELAAGNTSFDFEVRKSDSAQAFSVPQRLYGRENELSKLAAAFDDAGRSRGRIVVVRGPAGIGKSSLARELLSTVAARRGIFVAGKFEQYDESAPYSAYAQVIDSLARQLLTENSERLALARARIVRSTSGLSSVLIELSRALQSLLGQQPPATLVSPNDARLRLHQALLGILTGTATPEQPLCLFLDDLQWARPDSLEVLRYIALGIREMPILLVAASREQDSLGGSTTAQILEEAEASGVPVVNINLEPISRKDCGLLVRDSLSSRGIGTEELADTAFARTGGNPHFLREFLVRAHADDLIILQDGHWVCENARIRERSATENVLSLLIARFASLPRATQDLLKVAACLGNRFDVQTLAALEARETVADLWPAVAADVVIALDAQELSDELATSGTSMLCQFTHDQVQQAIMSSLLEDEGQELHLRVGSWFLGGRETNAGDLLEAVTHLNLAGQRALAALGSIKLAELNRDAASESLRRAAGANALQFAKAGLSLLTPAAWNENYDLSRDLYVLGAEAAFVTADYDTLEALAETTLTNVRTPLEAAQIRSLQAMMHYGRFALEAAIKTCLRALADLGIAISSAPTPDDIREEMRLTAEALRHKSMGDLLNLPRCSDPAQRMAMELLSRVILATASGLSDLFAVVVCRLVRLATEHGNIAESVNGYIFYGQLLSRDHDLERAYAFGKLALDVAHLFGEPGMLSHAYLYVPYQLVHWKLTFEELIPSLEKALAYGTQASSPFNTACSATTLCISRFWASEDLATLLPGAQAHKETVVRLRQGLVLNWHDIWLQVIMNLRLDVAEPGNLLGPAYDERERLPIHRAANDPSALFNYYVARATLCCHLGQYQEAVRCLDENAPLMPFFATQLWAIPVTFVDCLVRLALANQVGGERAETLISQVRSNKQKLETWLPHNRRSIAHKVQLIEAELLALEGNRDQARGIYAEAVRSARETGVPSEVGIACERAARFLLAFDGREAAREYLRGAHRAYVAWGATTKVKALQREFPNLLPRAISGSLNLSEFSRDEHGYDPLDLVSALNASRHISSVIRPEHLNPQLMALLNESAGAQLGYLIVERAGQWVIDCGQSVELGALTVRESIPLAKAAEFGVSLATSIVDYVTRSGETVLVDDASASLQFGRDPHVVTHSVRSVLCFPLKRGNAIVAVAYLENNLVRGAFTSNSLRLLELLSTQAVISLENSLLYADLEQKVERRTRELNERNQQLTEALAHVTEMQQQLVAQEKLAALGALTAGIAHEIKNPLNFVTNFATVSLSYAEEIGESLARAANGGLALSNEVAPALAELRRSLDKINEHGQRANAIVTEMASHARESGGRREPADLNAELTRCVATALEMTRHDWAREVEITVDFDTNLGLIDVIIQDLHRVLGNIVNNALDAMAKRKRQAAPGFKPQLRLRTRDVGSGAELCIRDNGIGIPQTSLSQIFQPFFTTKPAGEGIGLGLSISHDIVVRVHGGELRVESSEGEFAEVIVAPPETREPLTVS